MNSWHAPVLPQGALTVGMITSIEPGIYRPGKWGIRIENLVVNQPEQTKKLVKTKTMIKEI